MPLTLPAIITIYVNAVIVNSKHILLSRPANRYTYVALNAVMSAVN